ncbi:hypothetical protein U1Q18_006626 [Sarracenia purpurea var. burkii]
MDQFSTLGFDGILIMGGCDAEFFVEFGVGWAVFPRVFCAASSEFCFGCHIYLLRVALVVLEWAVCLYAGGLLDLGLPNFCSSQRSQGRRIMVSIDPLSFAEPRPTSRMSAHNKLTEAYSLTVVWIFMTSLMSFYAFVFAYFAVWFL